MKHSNTKSTVNKTGNPFIGSENKNTRKDEKQTDTVVDSFFRALELHVLTLDAWFSDGVAYARLAWLSSDLLPKLVRWTAECKSSEFRSTLSLLPVEKYSLMYQQLKEKYKAMVKVKRTVSSFYSPKVWMSYYF